MEMGLDLVAGNLRAHTVGWGYSVYSGGQTCIAAQTVISGVWSFAYDRMFSDPTFHSWFDTNILKADI
jgi:hypothetical protein